MTDIDEMKSWVLANAMQSRHPEFGEKILNALDELEQVRRDYALLQVSQMTVIGELANRRYEIELLKKMLESGAK